MSGRASLNPTYDMRQSMKSKDSMLSAEAPEFVPQFQKQVIAPEMAGNVGPPIVHQSGGPPHAQHQMHFNQMNHNANHVQSQQIPMMNQNQYRNHHMQQHYQHNNHQGPHSSQGNHKNSNYSVNQRLQQPYFKSNAAGNNRNQMHHHQQHNHHSHNSHHQHQPHHHQHSAMQQHHHNQHHHNQHHHQQQQMHQLQHQLGGMNVSKGGNNEAATSDNDEPSEAAMNALSFLIDIIEKLMDDPGQFENYQKELTTLYIDHADNQHVISNAIELFFTHSIDEQNFRYTGARLCRLLDSIDPSSTSLFRRLLCCKLQYNDSEIIQYMNNETHKVRNTTLFLAELYIQLQNDGSRITSIANSIHNAISLLMPKLSPENIKCVCQTLKLCGYELDIDFPKETEELMNQLSACENTDVSTQRLLTSVIELRKNRWGRSNDTTVLPQPGPPEPAPGKEFSNDPVFYGPDGNVLTEEESAFLWNATSCPNDSYDDDEEENDPDALVEIEPEMDLEIQLAFKDFVSYQNKK